MVWIPRAALLAGYDAVAWVSAIGVAATLRYDSLSAEVPWGAVGLLGLAAVVLCSSFGAAGRLYSHRYMQGSADEAIMVGLATVATGGSLALIAYLWPGSQLLPLSIPVTATSIALAFLFCFRMLRRRVREAHAKPKDARAALVVGAGDAGMRLIRDMVSDPKSPYLPVAMLDDDPMKQDLRVSGVRVRGRLSDLESVAEQCQAEVVIVAIPSAGADLHREVSSRSLSLGLPVKVLPSLAEYLDSDVGIQDLRDINICDVLGRRQIETDVGEIADYLRGRRILVTGAGGSIGSELSRQLQRFDPAEVILLDRDESALHAVQLSIHGKADLHTSETVLCDIRDLDSVRRVFEQRRPEVVFHAAALKHLNMLERHPDEAWKTNVLGTRNLLTCAQETGVSVFVNISTDKAAEPTSVLGWSKRIAERLTAQAATESPGRWVSVRFGNVLGSRGSVLATFAEQIRVGGPVSVTDPNVTRYFMTIPEAVQLVLQASALGQGREVLVLDMGEPVRIDDLAKQLIAMGHRPVNIQYTGLRPGEKLNEVLFSGKESPEATSHALIHRVEVPPLVLPEKHLAPDTAGADHMARLAELRLAEVSAGRLSA